MSAKKPAVDDEKATTVMASDPDELKGEDQRLDQLNMWR
jgi:hypothetical protein